jgi:ATP-binding cassette, subfamily B, beta-glucan exporter
MPLTKVYLRALGLLAAEKWLALWLVFANAAVGLVQLAEPILLGRAVDALPRADAAFRIIGLWAALGLVGIIANVLVAVAADRLAHRRRLAAMSQAFERAITLPIGYLAERGSGAMIRTIQAGADSLFGTWLTFMREQIIAMVSIAFLLPTAIAMNWRLAALLGFLAVLYALLNVLVVYRTSAGQAAVERLHIDVSGRVGDVIGNAPVVQSYARLAAEASELRGLMSQLLAAQYPILTWWGLLNVLTRAASTITMLAVFAVGADLASRGEVTVGEIVSFVGFALLLIGKLDQLSGFIARIFMQAPTLVSFFELLDANVATPERPDAKPLDKVEGRVRYESVTFRYGDRAHGVFDLDFEVKPGQTVALVGPTGAGKSTTLALLQRLRDPDAGCITVDGQDIRATTLQSLRHAIAMVFQDAGLFNRSISENIRVGRPEAQDWEVEHAAKLAEAHDFIVRKPHGYAFQVGERGGLLSGGERQRIAIARAILKNAPLLILDEATSALDTETEAKIRRALDTVRRGRTTLIIAHRLSTVATADLILVFDQGRIVERGSFGSLVNQGGLFARLVAEGGFTQPRAAAEANSEQSRDAHPVADDGKV